MRAKSCVRLIISDGVCSYILHNSEVSSVLAEHDFLHTWVDWLTNLV